MHIEPIVRSERKALHFCNPCGICKLDRLTLGSPLLCIYLNLLDNNLKENVLARGGTIFDCLSFLI